MEVRIKRKESTKIQYLLLKMIAGFGDSGAERYHLYKKIDLAVKHSVLPTRQKALNYLSKLRIRGYVAFYNRNEGGG